MYKIANDKMLEFFQSSQLNQSNENGEVRNFANCFDIVYAGTEHSAYKKVEFYTKEKDKPDLEYIKFGDRFDVLSVRINTMCDVFIEAACKKILEICDLYEATEICMPTIDLSKIDIILKYFDIPDIYEVEWGCYALLSNDKLPPLNLPANVAISLATSEQIEKIKSLDNDEWEILPDRCKKKIYNISGDRLLILLHRNDILAGYIEAICTYKNYYNICNVFVHEDFRGNNFGSLMTIYYANYCLDNGFIPHYGDAMSKYSENVAIKSGFEETARYHFFGIKKK